MKAVLIPEGRFDEMEFTSNLLHAFGRNADRVRQNRQLIAAEQCRSKNIDDVTHILSVPGDERTLRAAWEGWHTISPPMRKDYQRFVELSNQGARELGFADTGAMWRSKYDMPSDAFAAELDRLWEQLKPLYLSLHAYVRWKLKEKYGDEDLRRKAGLLEERLRTGRIPDYKAREQPE